MVCLKFYFCSSGHFPISYGDIVLTKVIAEIWKSSNIAENRSNGTRNMSGRGIRQAVNKLPC